MNKLELTVDHLVEARWTLRIHLLVRQGPSVNGATTGQSAKQN